MDAREQAADLLREANRPDNDWERATGMRVLAIVLGMTAIDEDLQKLRKELRTRNGGDENG